MGLSLEALIRQLYNFCIKFVELEMVVVQFEVVEELQQQRVEGEPS